MNDRKKSWIPMLKQILLSVFFQITEGTDYANISCRIKTRKNQRT